MLGFWEGIGSLIDTPTVLGAAVVALFAVAYAPRRMRALVIWIAQYSAFVAIALAAAVAGRLGYGLGLALAQSQNANDMGQVYYAVAGAAAGGLLGLVAAALAASVFFLLLEIRDNTRG